MPKVYRGIQRGKDLYQVQETWKFFFLTYIQLYVPTPIIRTQIREQMSVPDLYVLTVAFLALKKTGFSKKKFFSKIFFEKFQLYFMHLFSADATM